jgi:hypothetical protein
MAISILRSVMPMMPGPVPPPVTDTKYFCCMELKVSAVASAKGSTVVDPDTVTDSLFAARDVAMVIIKSISINAIKFLTIVSPSSYAQDIKC